MIQLAIDQQLLAPKERFSRSFLARVRAIFAKRFPQVSGAFQITFVTDEEIRRLNRMYRGKDAVTDVLSFPSGDAEISGMLGDVLISYDQAVRQADGDIHLECTDLLVHGLLHVLGYDHERPEDADTMFPLQDALVAALL